MQGKSLPFVVMVDLDCLPYWEFCEIVFMQGLPLEAA